MDYSNLNKYQTTITKELETSLPREIYTELIDFTTNIPFINWLIQPEEVRGFAKDRPRHCDLDDDNPLRQYDDNRIVVDLTKPHILEDMDFFRERAIFFDKYGKYTDITPNPNPNGDYALFWKEEVRRWKYGLIRPSDGEWIPGGLYFYWNYSPIWITTKTNADIGTRKRKVKERGERTKKFPKPWLGDYLFYHYMEQGRENGEHGNCLKCRGIGMSFKLASLSPRNMYVFTGEGNPNFHLASDKGYLSGDKGIWGKVISTLDWIANNTPLDKMRLTNGIKAMEIQLGYQDEYGTRQGLLSSVYGISLKDNPDKARGIRGPLVHYEELGMFANSEEAWNVNRKAVEDGDVAFGYMLGSGTANVDAADFEGLRKMFYSPRAFNIYPVKNVYDKNASTSECGFFWGAYLNRMGCYDIDTGEPDVIKALIQILEDRYRVKYNSQDPKGVTIKKAEEPIVPADCIVKIGNNYFPIDDIKNRLAEILPNYMQFISGHYVGDLVINGDGEVEWKMSSSKNPIRQFPFEEDDRTGCIEIYTMPKRFGNGTIPTGRYILGADVVDDDEGTSLCSVFVFDRWSREIVAEYTGRPRMADDFYEICYRLCRYYNGILMYENNKKGLFTYFRNKNILHWLADSPKIVSDKVINRVENALNNKTKGYASMSVELNRYLRKTQAKWMLEPLFDDEGESKGLTKMHTIRSIAYLQECATFNEDGNFDRISAMNCVMIYDLELGNVEIKKTTEQIATRAHDKYFDKFYGNRSKMLNTW